MFLLPMRVVLLMLGSGSIGVSSAAAGFASGFAAGSGAGSGCFPQTRCVNSPDEGVNRFSEFYAPPHATPEQLALYNSGLQYSTPGKAMGTVHCLYGHTDLVGAARPSGRICLHNWNGSLSSRSTVIYNCTCVSHDMAKSGERPYGVYNLTPYGALTFATIALLTSPLQSYGDPHPYISYPSLLVAAVFFVVWLIYRDGDYWRGCGRGPWCADTINSIFFILFIACLLAYVPVKFCCWMGSICRDRCSVTEWKRAASEALAAATRIRTGTTAMV